MAVGPATENAVFELPASLDPANANPWTTGDADFTRVVTMTPQSMGMNALNGNFLLNGAPFDMDVINYTIPLNNVEIWNIVNNSPIGHPFHIHDVQFYILDRNGAAPAPEETGRKDVVFVPAMTSARFITAFEDFADEDTPYMYHCHMLTHEDGGMMGQFVVVDPSTIADAERERMSAPYPVPAHDHVALTHTGGSWSIWSIEGRLITRGQEQAKQFTVSTVDWEEGMYLFQSDETHHVQRFSVRH
jgi:bilirubin oxidase